MIDVLVNAAQTSKYKGSPTLPCSLVLSNTATDLTLFGNALRRYSWLNGLYKWTSTKP